MVVINRRSRATRRRGPHAQESPRPAAAPHPARFLFALTGLIAAASLIAACGTASAGGSGAKSGPNGAKVNLSVTIVHGTESGPKHWTLHCQPTGGTAPDATSACKALLSIKQPFAPVSKIKVCPMILASAEEIVIKGTWFGHQVDRVITDGGCDIGLFESLHKTFY
jgi:hypothetical protein